MRRIFTILAGIILLSSAASAQDATVRIHDAGNGETIPAEI